MKNRIYSESDLPCWLNAKEIATYLGLGLTATYEMIHDKNFPKVVHNRRILIPRDRFLAYLDQRIEDAQKREEE